MNLKLSITFLRWKKIERLYLKWCRKITNNKFGHFCPKISSFMTSYNTGFSLSGSYTTNVKFIE